MVVTNLYDHTTADAADSGSGDGSGSWDHGNAVCPTTIRPLGMAPPQFLLVALAAFMVATQITFWVVSTPASPPPARRCSVYPPACHQLTVRAFPIGQTPGICGLRQDLREINGAAAARGLTRPARASWIERTVQPLCARE